MRDVDSLVQRGMAGMEGAMFERSESERKQHIQVEYSFNISRICGQLLVTNNKENNCCFTFLVRAVTFSSAFYALVLFHIT